MKNASIGRRSLGETAEHSWELCKKKCRRSKQKPVFGESGSEKKQQDLRQRRNTVVVAIGSRAFFVPLFLSCIGM